MFKQRALYHFIAQALSARSDKLIPQRRDESQFVSPEGLTTPLLWILAFALEVTDRIQLSVSAWESDDAVESVEDASQIMIVDSLIKLLFHHDYSAIALSLYDTQEKFTGFFR